MEFCSIVKQVRKELGLSQEQLARELSISFSTVNRWENGKSKPSQMAKELFFSFCKNKDINPDLYRKGGA
ncbi:transcriptional regulator [Flavonifractor sp. An135]|jgi:putative transcriptional regulator|nr:MULTISPECIES: helix-turn-helix transcriptional regulator [Flavonifractor]OUO37611.1 transcriptional regulator [Flavonifractor sp. An306]OUQ26467.1 transcriptional regulator [Flavonifractor sp. An135]QIA30853.1 helix-turn-helix transcriptional regulator [Flavonifractor plautii]